MADSCSSQPVLDLLAAAKAGDEQALDEFLVRIQAPVAGFLRRRLQEPQLERFIEDVVSEVLIRVYRHYQQCDAGSDRSVMAWVLSIAHNEALRLLERHALRYGVLLGGRDPAQINLPRPGQWKAVLRPDTYYLDEEADRSDGLTALLEVLERIEQAMDPALAQVMYLRLVENRSWSEIAEALEVAASAAKRRFQRAQQSLAKQVVQGIADLPASKRSAAAEFLKRLRS